MLTINMVAVRALLFAAAIAASHIPSPTRAHGAMLNPPPRNAIDSTIPGADWGDGQNQTGHLEPLGVSCQNGTEPCRPGQSVFWFSQARIRMIMQCCVNMLCCTRC